MFKNKLYLLIHFFVGSFLSLNILQAQIPTPEEFVGFKVGADKKLFGWNKVVDYFWKLDAKSDRVHVQELGKSTLGKPFIMAIISDPKNIKNLAKYKNLQKQAANPRNLVDEDARLLAKQNKVVVMITLNIHSTEIASSQESIELGYLLATSNTPRINRILENVIILLIPSMNPDGMQMVVDWYKKYVDTPYEGSRLPFLYHPYAGHDNNRDWFMMNLVETKLISKQYYHEWFPEIVFDQHQMGSSSARLFLPPYADPLNPNLHPLVHAQMNKFGKSIVNDLQEQNFSGIVTDAFYTAWWQGTSIMTPWWHNMLGILSEVASAQIASPLFFPKGSLRGGRRGFPQYSQRMNFLDPWPGGWWRLRDIIDYELAITFSLLDLAARDKESIIYNFYRMNKDAIAKGEAEPPYAFIVPRQQHDPITASQMIDILMQGGVEVHQAQQDFFSGNVKFNQGDFVILLSQPFRPYVKDLLERQTYPDLRNTPDGPPVPPYDITGWTLPLMMGVESFKIDKHFQADLTQLISVSFPKGGLVEKEKGDYLISHQSNRSFVAVNRLLNDHKKVYWLKETLQAEGKDFSPGAIYIPFKQMKPHKMSFLAEELSLDIIQTEVNLIGKEVFRLHDFKLALYQPWTANMDEGWTRLILEQFEFSFKTLENSKMMKVIDLKSDYDVIILPDMKSEQIIKGRKKKDPDMYSAQTPPAYREGITQKGIDNLKEFVEKGGTLITLDSACDFAIERFGLPVENVLADVKSSEFFCPGSLLEIIVDNREPVGYGMPSKATAMFAKSPAFKPKYWMKRTGVIANYPQRNPLLSGWILGEEKIRGLSAILDIPMGKGRVVLIGFRCQNRAQTTGTYKFLFNAIHLSRAEDVVLEN